MSADSPPSSMFTFESAVHPCHVLRFLDEQRRRDFMCDITVVVEGQSFRAHRSVLAACSEHFAHRISSHAQHGLVVSLPPEVTVAGFEPLLKFAYTSKLLFHKENVMEIRNSTSFLGFKDLDEACFDFLLPKFFSNSRGYTPFQRKTCCKKLKQIAKADCGTQNDHTALKEKEVKPVSDSPSEKEVGHLSNQSVSSETGSDSTTHIPLPDVESTTPSDYSRQRPKYRKFQLACRKGTCHPSKSLGYRPAAAIEDTCSLSCLPCSSNGSSEVDAETPGRVLVSPRRWEQRDAQKTFTTVSRGVEQRPESDRTREEEICGGQGEEIVLVTTDEEADLTAKSRLNMVPPPYGPGASSQPSAVVDERSLGIILHRCPLMVVDDGCASTGSVEQKCKEDEVRNEGSVQQPVPFGERGEMFGRMETPARQSSAVQREVAGHLDKRLELDVHSASDRGSSTGDEQAHCPALACRSNTVFCPFLQDLEPGQRAWGEARDSGRLVCEGMSGAETSLCMSSLTSGEDGDSETETEGDSERARQMQLPFSVYWIVDLSRNDFQQLVKQQNLTQPQLDFVHDLRRRSKNRIAAQRCRKRKLDCLFNLECEINKLRTEKDKLVVERSHLNQLKVKTWQTVSALCQKVCSEANLQPEQLQAIAKYTSVDCPLASIIPRIDPHVSETGLPGLNAHQQASLEPSSSSRSGMVITGDRPHSYDGKVP